MPGDSRKEQRRAGIFVLFPLSAVSRVLISVECPGLMGDNPALFQILERFRDLEVNSFLTLLHEDDRETDDREGLS